jgi:hypothetical protein
VATLYYTQYFEVTIDGVKVSGGSRSLPEEITVDGDVLDTTKSLATATTWDVITFSSSVALSNFDFLYVSSADQPVYLELTADAGGENGTTVFAIEVQAGQPFTLGSDDCYENYTANFATGTAGVIDRLRIRNVSGSTSDVRVVAIT